MVIAVAVFVLFVGSFMAVALGMSAFGRWRGWSDYFAPDTARHRATAAITVALAVPAALDDRPRKTLGYLKPSERLAELLAHVG